MRPVLFENASLLSILISIEGAKQPAFQAYISCPVEVKALRLLAGPLLETQVLKGVDRATVAVEPGVSGDRFAF